MKAGLWAFCLSGLFSSWLNAQSGGLSNRADLDLSPIIDRQMTNMVFNMIDENRGDRKVSLQLFTPTEPGLAPVVICVPDVDGVNQVQLSRGWAREGIASVWISQPVWARAKVGQLNKSLGDFHFVYKQLGAFCEDDPGLKVRLDFNNVAAFGRGAGALVVQIVTGQNYDSKFLIDGLKAACVMSPQPPLLSDPGEAFEAVKLPFLAISSASDVDRRQRYSPEFRRMVYGGLPSGSKYELWLDQWPVGIEQSSPLNRSLVRNSYTPRPPVRSVPKLEPLPVKETVDNGNKKIGGPKPLFPNAKTKDVTVSSLALPTLLGARAELDDEGTSVDKATRYFFKSYLKGDTEAKQLLKDSSRFKLSIGAEWNHK